MSLLARWFGGLRARPLPPERLALAASADGRVGARLLADGRLEAWSLHDGERLLDTRAGGPGLALSPDGALVIAGDGVLREVDGGRAVDQAAFHGHPFFVGSELLRVGRGRLSLGPPGAPPRVELDVAGLDPSAAPALVVGPRWWALVDPLAEGVLLLDPVDGVVARASPGRGPAASAAWVGERLYIVQEGAIRAWGDPAPAARPHALQTLAVGAVGGVLTSLGLDGGERFEWLDAAGARHALPGRPPPSPWLAEVEGGVLIELEAGFVRPGEGGPARLGLPALRGRRRALGGPGGVLPLPGGRVFLGLDRPAVYRMSDATCETLVEIG